MIYGSRPFSDMLQYLIIGARPKGNPCLMLDSSTSDEQNPPKDQPHMAAMPFASILENQIGRSVAGWVMISKFLLLYVSFFRIFFCFHYL